MYSGKYQPGDPLLVNNTLPIDDVYYPAWESQILPGPAYSVYGNQHDGGRPLDTPWDRYARAYDPLPDTLVFGVPNLGSPGRGNPLLYPFTEIGTQGIIPVFTDYSDVMPFANPTRIIVYVDDLQYQGISPLELQPLLDAPEPWSQYTPQQKAGGG
jgi:hypothetical protein